MKWSVLSLIWCFAWTHIAAVPFTTQCWERLNGKQNMLIDGLCQQINHMPNRTGWRTRASDDWVYYPQQYVNVSLTSMQVSFATVGGCCAPNRFKPTGYVYKDDGHTYETTGQKIVAVADTPMVQTVAVEGWYMKRFVDDHSMNLTLLPSFEVPDKQSLLYGVVIDRAMIITYQFYDAQQTLIGNHSSGVLREIVSIPDITLPRNTRFIQVAIYGSRAFPPCFSYIYAGLYVDRTATTIVHVCSKMSTILQYLSLTNFILVPSIFAVMTFVSSFRFPPPARFLCRQPSHPILMCIFMMIGSFIFSQAWNLINSESSMFHEWLPRAAKIVELFLSFFLYAVYFYPVFLSYHASYRSRIANILGAYASIVLFALRASIDVPSFVITYARDVPFLIINILASIPAVAVNVIVVSYFLTRALFFEPCDVCRITFLEVQDIEEQYVRLLIARKQFAIARKIPQPWTRRLWFLLTRDLWKFTPKNALLGLRRPQICVRWIRALFGINEFVRIPFPIKTSLSLLLYCLGQLIPVLLTQMVGVGGVVPTHICALSPYLTEFQYHPDPMAFAVKTFMLMQIAVYVATLGAGGFCMVYALGILRRVTKDILKIRRGDYGLFKGKKNNDISLDDAIRFLGVCIGFGFTGTLYFMVEVSLIGTGIAMLIQLDKARDYVFQRLGYGAFFASFFIALVVQMIQKRITSIIFLQSGTRFSLQNRAPFLHYWYFMMFTSMTRALTSYILRTLKLILRYPLFSLRVDRNAETWSVRRGDGGFVAYCGVLLAEHEYNNPVVLIFVECVLHHLIKSPQRQTRCRAHIAATDVERSIALAHETCPVHIPKNILTDSFRKRARTRWFLAITLINNPMLRQTRKHALKKLHISSTADCAPPPGTIKSV